MSGFALHGISHTSPSQINTWIADPAYWVLTKLHGKSYDFGFAAERGKQIENAVVNILANGMSEEQAIKEALYAYDRFSPISADPKKQKEREVIAPCITEAVQALKIYGEPDFSQEGQHKIELLCNAGDWTLPVIGYLDLVYPQHNLVIDLKTTTRMPSEMSQAHQRQAAIYETAKGMQVQFLYVTPKKHSFLHCDRVPDVMKEVKINLIRQERFLSISEDKNVLASIVPVNCESYYWCEQSTLDRKELYGI